MSRQIQAYFRTEDEAEGARTKLLTYNTEQLEVGELQDSLRNGGHILVPLVPWSNSGTGGATSGVNGMGAPGGVVGAPGVIVGARDTSLDVDSDHPDSHDAHRDGWREADVADGDYDDLHYTLTVKVRDEDYEQIVHDLRANNGYVERLD